MNVTTYPIQAAIIPEGDLTCMWSRVAVIEHNIFKINELWRFLNNGFIEIAQLLTFGTKIFVKYFNSELDANIHKFDARSSLYGSRTL